MLRNVFRLMMLTALAWGATAARTQGQDIAPVNDSEQAQTEDVRIDRYLDVEIWTNHSENEYYDGDNVVLYFRANRDAFVSIYTIDTQDRVHLLFPSQPGQDNYVRGGETYRLPSYDDDFDLVVSGPAGTENVQIIASREKFPIPDWYDASGLTNDAADVNDFMDYVNARYFVGYSGQKFAYDRTALYINDWEPYYFHPVYHPYYPSWTVAGNVYIDYPYGGSVYIDGIYWGCVPLYIPRLYVGWHTFTIYDRWNHCWEHDVHVTHYNTVVLNNRIIQTSPKITSRYERVRVTGYKDPVKAGYTNYNQQYEKAVRLSSATVTTTTPGKSVRGDETSTTIFAPTTKKFVRGSTDLTSTTRGYEPAGTGYESYLKSKGRSGTLTPRTSTGDQSSMTPSYEGSISKRSAQAGDYLRKGEAFKPTTTTKREVEKGNYQRKTTVTPSGGSSDYYLKRSGANYRKTTPNATVKGNTNSGSSKRSTGTSKTYTRPKTSTSGSSGKSYRPTRSTTKSSGSSQGSSTKSAPRKTTSTAKKSGGKR